jgi:hypothetical protein
LANGGELSTKFLLSLGCGRVLVVRLGALDLGLDLVLRIVSIFIYVMQFATGRIDISLKQKRK